MRFISRAVALLIFVGLSVVALPADEKTADKTTDKTDKSADNSTDKTDKSAAKTDKTATKTDKSKTAKKAKKDKLEYSFTVTGKITKVDDSSKGFTVELAYGQRDPQRVVNNQNHYLQRMMEISLERDYKNRQRQLAELSIDMARRQAEEVVGKTQKVAFDADDNMKVRTKDPPYEYDDKGNPKKLSSKELKALRGPDTTLPGYTAEFENVKVGSMVTVYVAKPKPTSAKTKTDDTDAGPMRPRAVMIYIIGEAKAAH